MAGYFAGSDPFVRVVDSKGSEASVKRSKAPSVLREISFQVIPYFFTP